MGLDVLCVKVLRDCGHVDHTGKGQAMLDAADVPSCGRAAVDVGWDQVHVSADLAVCVGELGNPRAHGKIFSLLFTFIFFTVFIYKVMIELTACCSIPTTPSPPSASKSRRA